MAITNVPDPLSQNNKIEKVNELYFPLINRFYADCNYRVKCGRHDQVYSCSLNGKIISAMRLIAHPSNNVLLRNLCVSPEYRQQGVATSFTTQVLQALAPQNCYCFTSTPLQHFYEAIGFVCLAAEEAPQEIGDLFLRYRSRKRGWILMGFMHNDKGFS